MTSLSGAVMRTAATSGVSLQRSTVTRASTVTWPPAWCWRRCTCSRRAPLYPSRRTSFQMPIGGNCGPQSQPNWHGALRRYGPPGNCLGDPRQRANRLLLAGIAHGRTERDLQLVGYTVHTQQWFGVPAVLPEHVVGMAQFLAVERDRRQGIQPVADEQDLIFSQHLGCTGKATPVLPIGLGDPLDALLVVSYERIRDAPAASRSVWTPPGTRAGNHSSIPAWRNRQAPVKDWRYMFVLFLD